MPFRIRVSLAILLGLLTLFFVGPLITPVRPLSNIVPIADLTDEDSQFVSVKDIEIHYKSFGNPDSDPVYLLLHGFGAHSYTWHELTSSLAERSYVIAFDRPAFGFTERPLKEDFNGFNPYTQEAQLELIKGLMDALSIEQALFIGHSAGARISVEFALAHPDKVTGLVLLDAAIYNSGARTGLGRLLLFTPQMNRMGPLFMRQFAGEPGLKVLRASWANPDALDDETLEAYQKPLQAADWDKALWELTKASSAPQFIPDLPTITQPALILTGLEDKTVPPELSKRLDADLPNSTYAEYEACGHVPQEECPIAVLETLQSWLNDQNF